MGFAAHSERLINTLLLRSEGGQNTSWLLSYTTTHVNGSIALQLEDFLRKDCLKTG
jgi:hypothetical protein